MMILRVLMVALRLPLVFLHQVEAVVAQLVTPMLAQTVGQVVVMLVVVVLLVGQETLADTLQLRVMMAVVALQMEMAVVGAVVLVDLVGMVMLPQWVKAVLVV